MSFIARLQRARQILEQEGRLSTRALERELETGGDELDELVEELVDVQQVARREGKILIWTGGAATLSPDTSAPSPRTIAPTQPAADQNETRKVISVIFADLMGSTALQERLDPESVNRVMDAYYQAVRVPVEAAGGTVVQLLGDGVLCAFGIPRIAEDDALRAVRAAVGIQQAFREFVQSQQWLTVSIGLRVAVNTGEVVVNDEHPAGIGDPLNVAARLQQEARDGEVLIGQATRRLVADTVTLERAGTFALKGRAETVTAYRVVSLERPTGTTAAFVGRAEELARLTSVYEAAVATPAARLAVLLGSPGLGKSRLIDELGRRVGDAATVIAAQCDAAGGATFAPVADALRQFLGDRSDPSDQQSAITVALGGDAAERTRIAAGITAVLGGSPPSPEETFFVIRRLLTALAKEKPVVLVIDDLQWAEPLLLDLVEHLIQWCSGVPLFVLIGARPELRNRRSSLATAGGFVSEVITLSGLDAGAAMRLAANVIGAADLPAAVVAKVLATSEGNPLFVGELVRMLVDEGAIEKQGERWIVGANLAALEMPPTIHALLASRLERLRPEERTVLERASVVGRHFSRSAVAALLGANGSALDGRLEALRRTELIEPDTGWLLGEPVLRFHHVLIRDAAYRRLLKGTRAELHERLANWMEAQVRDAPEHDETIGRHLERAHQLLREIGPLDASGKALGERAAHRLSDAGRRALERDDAPVAADLLGRAIECLNWGDADGAGLPPEAAARRGSLPPEAAARRGDLALDWCEALLSAGDVGLAAKAIEELGRFAGAASTDPTDPPGRSDPQLARLRAWHTCFSGHLAVMTAPQELQAAADAVAAAVAEFSQLDDDAGKAKAHFVHALALARLGKVGACEAALDQALAAARKAGDRRRANTVLAIAPLAALWGPSPVTRASGRCLDVVRVLRITQGAPAVEAVALSCQGVLEALRGRTEAAHRMIASGRKMVEELGIAQRLFETDVFAGFVALLEGDVPAAERTLRGAYDGLRDLGLGIDAARAAALLARALLAQDRIDEAEALSHESEALAGDDLKAAIAWRGVRAEALAKRGEHTDAIELARAAVAIAASTDALLDHADARLALAAALRAAGRGVDADAEDRHAIELWEAKGATLLAEQARRAATSMAPPVAAAAPRVAHAPRRRPVRPNFAIEEARRAEAAVAERDVQALQSLYRRDVEIVDHQFGVEYGHDAIVERVRLTIEESSDGAFRHEDLATLGDFVALCRLHSSASGSVVHDVPFGPTEVTYLLVIEADDQGCARRIDIFGEDALRDAVVRLYERHAALLPEGAERTRAAATAQSMAVLQSANADPTLLAPVLAPDIEGIDHRHLSNWSLHGAPAYLDHLRALHQVADDVDFRWQEILALAADALLARTLHHGTERVGGGTYERWFLSLFVVGADGRITRAEWFDEDHEAEALARFEELVPGPVDGTGAGDEVSRLVRRRVRPNAASALMKGIEAGFAARDRDAIQALLADPLHNVEHPTGSSYGREGQLESIDRVLRLPNLEFRMELLATLGDALCLARRRVTASGTAGGRFDVAEFEIDHVGLQEVDADGRLRRSEVFASERLGDAITRLYECYAEQQSDDAGRERAAGIARSLAAFNGPIDPDRVARVYDPASRNLDHRVLGTWTTKNAAELLSHYRHQLDLAPDFAARFDDVLALEPDAMLAAMSFFGTARKSGGAFENRLLVLFTFGADGRITETENFEAEQGNAAQARFDKLGGCPREGDARPSPADRGFSNAATRLNECFARAWAERDWNTVSGAYVAGHHVDDRRRLMQMRLPDGDARAALRFLFDVPGSRWVVTPLATRGEHLVVSRYVFEGTAGANAGPIAIDYLAIDETNADGRFVETVLFDPDDLDAAYAELDRRYGAGDGRHDATWQQAHRLAAALPHGDIDACRAMLAPGFRVRDHRKLSWGDTLRDGDTFLQAQRALSELSPDWRYRIDHHRARGRVQLGQQAQVGTREGGAFENPFLVVAVYDEAGLVLGIDTYDVDQLEQAHARFEELADAQDSSAAFDPVDSFFANAAIAAVERGARGSNAAMRAMSDGFDAYDRAFEAGTWDELRRGCHPGIVFDDRRRMALLRGDVDLMVASARERAAMGARPEWRPVGYCGDRVFVGRVLWVGGPADGPFEIEYLGVVECDENGLLTAFALFDLDDARAAQREAWARWAAIEPDVAAVLTPVGEALDAFNEKSAAKWRAAFADDLVVEDHRLAGMGRVEGADAYTESIVALWKLAPVTHADLGWRWPALDRHGAITVLRRTGTVPDGGGDFENEYLYLYLVAQGRIARVEMFEMNAMGEALARFEELRTPSPRLGRTEPDPLHIPPNAAMRGMDRWVEASLAGDADAVVALLDPSYTLEDRRPLFRTVSDRNSEIAVHLSLLHEGGWQPARTLLTTAGDRLALQRWLWTKGETDARSEIEFLEIDELGDSGRFVRSIIFDPDDRAAASRELLERYAATGADGKPHGSFETMRGWQEHDLVRVRGGLSEDFVLDDHRLAGMGRLEGPDAYIESVAALFELIPDARSEFLYFVAIESHGRVSVNRTWGLNREGGEVESFYVLLSRFRDGKVSYLELFEVEHLDVALARLADLRLGRTNAATRARDRQHHAFVARGWDAIRRLATADFVLEDRGKRALVTGDVEAWIASMQFTSQPGWRPRSTLIGTFGNHIVLDRVAWSGEPGGDAFESERVRVLEADAEGRMRAVIMFDPEDLWRASQEAMMRFAAADGAEAAGVLAASNAVNERRWDELRMGCAPDFVCVDHRPLGLLGTLDREQWVESLKAIVGLSDGVTYASYDVLAWNESGIVTAVARHGTVPNGGGDFEDGFLAFYQFADGRLVRMDLFAEDDTESALACFAEQRSRR